MALRAQKLYMQIRSLYLFYTFTSKVYNVQVLSEFFNENIRMGGMCRGLTLSLQ